MKNNTKLIHEAILNDKIIQHLNVQKSKIYSFIILIVILNNGKYETILQDETNHLLFKINEQIECRKNQIINFYSR